MLTKLIHKVKAALNYEMKETFGWLDSQTALCWLDNQGEWKQFERKRVDQILEAGIQWRYCPTEDNPADLATRGTTPERFQACSNWWEDRNGSQEGTAGHKDQNLKTMEQLRKREERLL